jgi:murein DD-endopeptidase MepM/ murein hydrolase activator NlpD
MVFRKIIVFCFIFLFSGFVSYSQSIMLNLPPVVVLRDDDISLDEDENICLDSLSNMTVLGIIDPSLIPAAALYNYIWDNNLVNPYGRAFANMPDTVVIDFSQYHHPNKNPVTSDFGFRRGWRFHYGIDTRLTTGDSIYSSFDGMVRIVARGRAYGNYVVVRHFNGFETVYAHLSKHLVNVNQIVRAGEAIGLGGSTGRSTGPHLHYELRFLGQPLSPRDFIDFENFEAIYRIVDLNNDHFAYLAELEQIRYYTVRRGDTLSGISRRLGVSTDKLARLNNISRNSTLRIGQRLRYT